MSVFLDSRAIIAPLHIKYNDLCKFLTNRRHKKSRIPHTIKDARYLILFITEIPAGPQTEHTVLFCSFFLFYSSALAAISFSCTSDGACSYLANSYAYVPLPPVMERSTVQYPNNPVIGMSASITCFPPAIGVMPSTRPRLLFRSPITSHV